jgi:hypothetical protein
MNVVRCGCACGCKACRLLIDCSEQCVAIEHVVGRGRVFRSRARRRGYGVPFEWVDVRRGRSCLENAGAERVVSVGRGRTSCTQRGQAICIIVNICCSPTVFCVTLPLLSYVNVVVERPFAI